LESLDLVTARRPDVHVLNELLEQYPLNGRRKPGQVVPDNMVVIYDGSIQAEGSYNIPKQPVGPFWVLEYVSKSNKRKDYDQNMDKYEHELKVPYYLLFVPDEQEMTLYRHTGKKYSAVFPDEQGRVPLPELDLEMGLHQCWVRFWFRGELLPLPADLLRAHDDMQKEVQLLRKKAAADAKRAKRQAERADAAEAEVARLRAELEAARRQAPGK
jgi:hypothetical protein